MSDGRNLPDSMMSANPMNMNHPMHPNLNLGYGINPNMGQQMMNPNMPPNMMTPSMNYNTMGHMAPNHASFSVPNGLFPAPHGHSGYPMGMIFNRHTECVGMGIPNSSQSMNHPMMVPYPAPIRTHDQHKVVFLCTCS